MKLKNMFYAILAILVSASTLTSCEKDPVIEKVKVTSGVYVLNSGKFKLNNASISYYDVNTKAVTPDIFYNVNNRGLGDTGQDMLIYGSKMYASVYNSGLIEVLDANTAKSIKTIKLKDDAGNPRSPRTITAANGKIYIVLYDGYVASMDTANFNITKTIKVGANPDGSVISGNKLFVANTGGMTPGRDKTVSVVDLAKFEETSKVTVNLNPQTVKADNNGNIFVISNGNYKDIPGKFQRISSDLKTVTDIDINNAKGVDIVDNKAYIYTFEYDENWQAANKRVIVYDCNTNKIITDNILKSNIEKTPYCIDVNPVTKDIYVGDTDYVNNGKMYCFGNDGTLKTTFNVGVNPCKTVFLMK